MNKGHNLETDRRCPVCEAQDGRLELYWESHSILQCNSCGLVYAWPRGASEGLYELAYGARGTYNKYIPSGHNDLNLHATWAMRHFLRDIKPRGDLLDIGCSTGGFMLFAQQKGWQVTGVEVSEKAASVARDLTGASVFAGTITDFKPDRLFEAITVWETLEHLAEPVDFLHSALGLLKSGGVLALSTPHWGSPWIQKSTDPEHWPPYHLTFWDKKTLWALLIRLNLKNLVIKEKPFAWEEEVGRMKWVYLPVALARSLILQQKGMHLYAAGLKI
jgi:2-polyprenyl-3-methyl-5-hydroxy-6-metoxy-1,4-benzoquinol methylase